MRRLLVAVFVLLGCVFCCTRAADATIARSAVWTIASHSSSCATGCPFTVTVSPASKDGVVISLMLFNSSAAPTAVVFSDNNGGTWTTAGQSTSGNRSEYLAWHITPSVGTDTTYTITPTVATGTTYIAAVVQDFANVNTSTFADGSPVFGAPLNGLTATGPAYTTTVANDMVLYGFGNANQAETGITAGWAIDNGGNSANVFESVAYALQSTAGAVTAPTITYGVAASNIITYAWAIQPTATAFVPSLPIAWAGGPHISQSIPTPPPAPANTPPPPATYMYFNGFGENINTTPAQVTQYMNTFCEGLETTGGGASIFNCGQGQGQYWSLNMGQATLAGHDTSVPWAAGETGTGCPEPSGSNFWASTVPAYTDPNVATNWFLWPNGTTVGTINATSDIGMAAYPTGATSLNFNLYLPFMNMASPTLQSYVQAVLKHCGDHDRYSFAREDNATFGNESLEFTPFGNHNPPSYQTLKNFGASSGGPPYVSTNCNGGGHLAFGSTRCTRSALLTSVDTTTQTYPTDASFKAAYCSMFNSLDHNNGKPMLFMTNGAFSTDSSVLGCAHVFSTQAEQYIVKGCGGSPVIGGSGNNIINPCLSGLFGHATSFSADNVATVINWCATTVADDPGKQNQIEDFASVAQGSAMMQWNFRAHWGAMWSCEYDPVPNMMISFGYFGFNVTGDIGIYAPDFVEPFHRITPFPRRPTSSGGSLNCAANSFANFMGSGSLCTVNGINDPNICRNAAGTGSGSGNSCVVVTEFADTYDQATPDLTKWPSSPVYAGTNTVSDLGKSCLIDNNTAAGIQITSTVLANLCPNTAAVLTKVAAFCTPSGYFNTSGSGPIYSMPSSGIGNVCSGTSGASVNQGGAFDHSTLLSTILNEFLPPGDVLLATQT